MTETRKIHANGGVNDEEDAVFEVIPRLLDDDVRRPPNSTASVLFFIESAQFAIRDDVVLHRFENASPIIRCGPDRVNVEGVETKDVTMPSVNWAGRSVARFSGPISAHRYPQLAQARIAHVSIEPGYIAGDVVEYPVHDFEQTEAGSREVFIGGEDDQGSGIFWKVRPLERGRDSLSFAGELGRNIPVICKSIAADWDRANEAGMIFGFRLLPGMHAPHQDCDTADDQQWDRH